MNKTINENVVDEIFYSGCNKHKTWKIGCKECQDAMSRVADGLLEKDGTILLDTRPHKVNK